MKYCGAAICIAATSPALRPELEARRQASVTQEAAARFGPITHDREFAALQALLEPGTR